MPVPAAVTKPLRWLAYAAIGTLQMIIGLVLWAIRAVLEAPLAVVKWLQVHFPGPNYIWNLYCRKDVPYEEPTAIPVVGETRETVAPVAGPSGVAQQQVLFTPHDAPAAVPQQRVPQAVYAEPTQEDVVYQRPAAPAPSPAVVYEPPRAMPEPGRVPIRAEPHMVMPETPTILATPRPVKEAVTQTMPEPERVLVPAKPQLFTPMPSPPRVVKEAVTQTMPEPPDTVPSRIVVQDRTPAKVPETYVRDRTYDYAPQRMVDESMLPPPIKSPQMKSTPVKTAPAVHEEEEYPIVVSDQPY